MLAAVIAMLAGCAALAPGSLPAGTPIAQARQMVFRPSAEYALPGGGTRLEFPQGRQTWMLDFDAAGTLVSNQQVLSTDNFDEIKPGMSQAEVRMRLGRPVDVFGAGWKTRIHVWNYRFNADCVWFQVSIADATGQVTEAGISTDPACDRGRRDPL